MSLKAVVDEVPEGLEDYYQQSEDGKWTLDVEGVGGYALEDVSGLKHTLSEVKKEKAEALEASKTRGTKLGKLEEEIADLQKVAAAGGNAEAFDARVDAEAKKIRRGFQSKLDESGERNKLLEGKMDELVRKDAVQRAITKEGGNADLLLPHVLGRTKLNETDGEFSVSVLDEKGQSARNETGDPLTVSDFVVQLKGNPAFAPAFSASGATGTGKVPQRSSGEGLKRSEMTAEQKRDFLTENSQEAYFKLPK